VRLISDKNIHHPEHQMSLVRVWTDVGARKPVALLAKIIEKDGVILTIRYLSESADHIWRYETDTYEIDDDSIAEYLKTDKEDDIGFVIHEDGFLKVESDEDYVPSDEESESETDSFEESDEDEDDQEGDEFEESESDAESEESLSEE
jgi:hypothetical protein